MKKNEDKKKKKIKTVYQNYNDHIKLCYKISKDPYFKKQLIRNFLVLKLLPFVLLVTPVLFVVRAFYAYPKLQIFLKNSFNDYENILDSLLEGNINALKYLDSDIQMFLIYTLAVTVFISLAYFYYLYKRSTDRLFVVFDREFKKFSQNEEGEYKNYFIKTPKGVLVTIQDSTISSIKKNSGFWEKLHVTPGEYIESKDQEFVFFTRGFALPKELVY